MAMCDIIRPVCNCLNLTHAHIIILCEKKANNEEKKTGNNCAMERSLVVVSVAVSAFNKKTYFVSFLHTHFYCVIQVVLPCEIGTNFVNEFK